MPTKPPYLLHEVEEKEITVDWYFGPGHPRTKIAQSVLILVGWFFAILPIVVTASALLHRHDAGGWWSYSEGFAMWDVTITCLGILLVVFIIGFLALHILHRQTLKRRNQRRTYDEERLARRLELADAWYADKYGPEAGRFEHRRIVIQPHGNIETYELRTLYRDNEVG